MLTKDYYNTILSQTFSPCGNYLVVGDIYGEISLFHLSKIVETEVVLSKDDLVPKNRFTVKDEYQINSLLSMPTHLIVGAVGEILAFTWKSVKTVKKPQLAWSIDLPEQHDAIGKSDVVALVLDDDKNQLYAACGDHVYVFDVETRKLLKTLKNHTDYLHCITKLGNDLVSSGEDGVVNIWDLRTCKVSNKIEPHLNDTVARADIGKWIGALSINEDYVLCGGGPRLSLWHYRFLSNSTLFPIEDKGIHVADICNEKILAGGVSKLFYQMSFMGEVISEIPVTAVTTYSAIHQKEPYKVLSIAGSSPKIDICSNFLYKNQQLCLS